MQKIINTNLHMIMINNLRIEKIFIKKIKTINNLKNMIIKLIINIIVIINSK